MQYLNSHVEAIQVPVQLKKKTIVQQIIRGIQITLRSHSPSHLQHCPSARDIAPHSPRHRIDNWGVLRARHRSALASLRPPAKIQLKQTDRQRGRQRKRKREIQPWCGAGTAGETSRRKWTRSTASRGRFSPPLCSALLHRHALQCPSHCPS